MIAGFEVPTTGKVILDDVEITDKAPNQRNVGMVFQAYALFPKHDSCAKHRLRHADSQGTGI